jgi:16S rRNA (guanine1207-N2)-methyltransferase
VRPEIIFLENVPEFKTWGTSMTKTTPLLRRYPYKKDDPLQAWDAADELILEHVSEFNLKTKRILVVGDSFGAIS